MLRASGLTFAYPAALPVLRETSFEVGPGVTLLVGPNGCGKTTLLRLLAGVERPDEGSITLDGQDLWGDEVAARRSLAYIPEYPDVTPYASVGDVLTLVARLRREPLERARTALRAVGLETLAHRSIRELSFGQRRRVLLGAAMIGAPSHLLLDEPLEGLDRSLREQAVGWLEQRLDGGATAVLAAHDVQPFLARASAAATVREGRIEICSPLPQSLDERSRVIEALSVA